MNIAIVRSHLSNLKYGTKLSSRIFNIDMAMLKIKFEQKSFHVISQINLTLGCKVKLAIDKSYWRVYCIKVLCLVQICSSCKNLKFSCSDILIHNCKNTHIVNYRCCKPYLFFFTSLILYRICMQFLQYALFKSINCFLYFYD